MADVQVKYFNMLDLYLSSYVHILNSTTLCYGSGWNCFCHSMRCRPVVHACFPAASWLIALVYSGMINDVTLWSRLTKVTGFLHCMTYECTRECTARTRECIACTRECIACTMECIACTRECTARTRECTACTKGNVQLAQGNVQPAQGNVQHAQGNVQPAQGNVQPAQENV